MSVENLQIVLFVVGWKDSLLAAAKFCWFSVGADFPPLTTQELPGK